MLEDVKRRRLPLPDRGVEIALMDWGGEGPLALLHHANGFCAALWDPVARGLRDHYRVIAMDARGHGDSSRPEGEDAYAWDQLGEDARAVANALAGELGLPRVGLALGHSFGGTSLMLAAAQQPGLFEALVMLDPVLHPPPPPGQSPEPERIARVDALADRARRRRQVFESRDDARAAWQDKPLFADWQPRSFELYLQEGLAERSDGRVELKCPNSVEAAIFRKGMGFDAWSPASRVATRSLLVWAERGDFPRFVFESVAQRMPDASIRDVALGHLMVMEDPEQVVRVVLDFARAGDGAPAAARSL